MQVLFMGCSDDQGVPRIGCECAVCHSALAADSKNRRTGPSLALRYGPAFSEQAILIDAAPEYRLQATGLGLNRFDALLLTHAHDAHIQGLSPLVRAQRYAQHPLMLRAPDQVLEDVRARFGHLWADKAYQRILQAKPLDGEVDLWGLGVHPLRVDHGMGGTAYGYLLTLGDRRLAYISDMLRATAGLRETLTGLDLLVLGASHYYESIELWKRSVIDIMAALELIHDVEPQQAVLTHLSHTVDFDEVSAKLPPHVRLAYDGLVVEVHE
jgi:phosphoribosyl 1,2-cyclic phosphate phosphodiesterase